MGRAGDLPFGGGRQHRDPGAQTAGAASGATFTFSGPTTLSANVDTTNATGGTQDITFNNAVTLGANAQVLGGTGGDIHFASTLDGAFDLTLNTGGAITLTGNVSDATPLDDLTLTSDADPTIGGTVEGAGVLPCSREITPPPWVWQAAQAR